jgi:hypothetical protein
MRYMLVIAAVLLAGGTLVQAQDVTTTNSIRPGNPLGCKLDAAQLAKVQAMSVDDVAKLTGCQPRKVSSFEWLGQTTDIYEFQDGSNRLQMTLQNNKTLSRTFRKL